MPWLRRVPPCSLLFGNQAELMINDEVVIYVTPYIWQPGLESPLPAPKTYYEKDLEANLPSLLDRAKSGTYFAPPVRRVHIPKGTGNETRSFGMPTTEDKLLQRAVAMILEPIYEQDFLDCSYGFRPKRSAHGALSALWNQCMTEGTQWLLDMDISKFFDTLDKTHLRSFLQHRVRDGVIQD